MPLQLLECGSTYAHLRPLLTDLIAEENSALELQPKARVNRLADQSLDTLIDFMLAGPIPQLVSRGTPALRLPDLSFRFDAALGEVLKIAGEMTATGGAVEDVKSLFRQGPTVLRLSSSGILLLDVTAGLRLLRVLYANYSASVNGVRASGRIEVEASPASVAVQVALLPPCRAQLSRLDLSRLGAVRVHVSGLPPALTSLPDVIESLCGVTVARQAAASVVLDHVAHLVSQQLQRMSCSG
ncbi:hypothetical protein R5R35_013553 [Gryllus longicercus]